MNKLSSRMVVVVVAIVGFLCGMGLCYFAIPHPMPSGIITLTCPLNAENDLTTVNIPIPHIEDNFRITLNCSL